MDDEVVKRWLSRRAEQWRELEQLLDQHQKSGRVSLKDTQRLLEDYQQTQGDFTLARTELPQAELTRSLEALLIRTSQELAKPVTALIPDARGLLGYELPVILMRLIPKLAAMTALFVFAIAVSWVMVAQYPELIAAFFSPPMIDAVHRGELWTEGIFNVMPSSVAAFSIMTNNIMVSFMAFALGSLYGIGTLYIVVLNGMMLGCAFSYTAQYGLDPRLMDFIIAHGCVELSIIILAATAGFALGDAIAHPGQNSRMAEFRRVAREGVIVCGVCVPFLIIAGIIEGYVSPSDAPFAFKVAVGVGYWLVFIYLLSGKPFRYSAMQK
ncbi:MAG: stage II sporulation protein M [Pseudomonadales bacterium]